MDKFLAGKHAVVTGGTRGIGRKVCESLLSAGAAVAFCGRSADTVKQAEEQMGAPGHGPAVGLVCDVSKWDQVERFFGEVGGRFGGVDILINNAGIGVFSSVADLTPEDWHKVVDLNLSGVFYCCRAVVPWMKRRGGGHIIQIGSLAGKNAFAGGSAYNASKFGLNGFSEAIMQDLRYEDIRVSTIMPGSVETDFGSRRAAGQPSWKIAPEDVAEVVLDLLKMPVRTLVSRVEMRPSKPAK